MHILSWNVNGIRAVIKNGFLDFLKKEDPDILCLQEIKISDDSRAKENFDFANYQEYWHSAIRPGYSGTAVLVKNSISAPKRLPDFLGDDEGRVLTLEFADFILVNIYFMNAKPELVRIKEKIEFNDRLLKYFQQLEKRKSVIVCGDLNVAHQEIDLARPKENIGSPGFSDAERAWMNRFLDAGFVDTFRHFYPEQIQYSWWSYRMGARAKNIGWRIDYFCVSKNFLKNLKNAFILDQVLGSDHCPVGIET